MRKSRQVKRRYEWLEVRGRGKQKVIVGICGDAETLGVDRVHLYKVLTGQRESKRLLAQYKALKQI